jgi:hypothetical protein
MKDKLNPLHFYKPNSYNKGIACSFNEADDGGLYVSFIRQHSWNAATRSGSFKANMNNPKAKKGVKFSVFEAGGLVRSIEGKEKWSSYHKFGDNGGISIQFGPYEKDGTLMGFGLKVVDSKDKDNLFAVGFTLDEAIALKLYLEQYVTNSFYKNKKANPEAQTEETDF